MQAEILAIGSELVQGTTIDTNSAYLAQQLASVGLAVVRTGTVGDNLAQAAAALTEALLHRPDTDVIICTGGLGPTVDDITREAVAQATGRPLEFRPELLEQINARFAAMQRPMSESNQRQAYLPQGARAIENPRGTAPGFIIEDPHGTIIGLPGVPHEMRFLCENALLPYLRDERGCSEVILVQTLHAAGQGESVIGEHIADLMQRENPALGISAKQARYELRITARASSQEAAQAMIAATESTLRERLGDMLLGTEELHEQVGRLLHEHNLTLALYEGHIAAPVYRTLSMATTGRERLHGVVIHTLDTPTDEEGALSLADAGAQSVQNRWRSSLALGLQIIPPPDNARMSTICMVLVFRGGRTTLTQQYELDSAEGWGIVGTLALNMLREYLLASAAPA
jgi:competence/damage-inducible protein CinA-like protein